MNLDIYIESLSTLSAPTMADGIEIGSVLNLPSIKRTFGLLMQEVNGKMNQLTTIDFTKGEATLKAARLQGEIAGARRIFDIFLEVMELSKEKEMNNE